MSADYTLAGLVFLGCGLILAAVFLLCGLAWALLAGGTMAWALAGIIVSGLRRKGEPDVQ